MKRIVSFEFKEFDPFIEMEVDFDLQVGDLVYYSMTKEEHEKEVEKTKNTVGYPIINTELEATITLRWVDLNNNKVLFIGTLD